MPVCGWLQVLGLGLSIMCGLSGPLLAGEISGGIVKVGIINDQSGNLSDMMGPGSVVAARMAAEDFAKANPTIKVEVISADHQNKADIGSSIVRKWIDVDGVDLIADVGNSAVGLAVQNVAREKNKIVIYTAVATTELTNKQCSPTGISWLHDSFAIVSGPIKKLVPQGADTWFFIGADYAFGRNMVAESERVLGRVGGKTIGSVFHPVTETDFSSYLLRAQASKAKVVAFANAGQQLVSSMKQWQEFNMGADGQRPVAQLVFDTDVHAMGLKLAAGLTSVTGWYWELDDASKAFARRFFERHKAMPTAPQAAVYSGVLHYLKAVAATGTDDTNAVIKQMRATPVDDFFGKGARIREDGKLMHDFYVFEVKKPSESKEPWDYYKILATVPANEAYPPLSESECPLVRK